MGKIYLPVSCFPDGSEHFLVPAQKSTSIYDAVAVNEPSCKNEEIKVERKRSFSKTSLGILSPIFQPLVPSKIVADTTLFHYVFL